VDVRLETVAVLLILAVAVTMVAASSKVAARKLLPAAVATMAVAPETVAAKRLLRAVVATMLVLPLAASQDCWIAFVHGWLATRLAVVPALLQVAAKPLLPAVVATTVAALVPLVVAMLTPLPLLLLPLSQFLPNRLLILPHSTPARTASFKPA